MACKSDMFSICCKSAGFRNLFFHFVSDGRQHDFHKFCGVCEMTVSVMFLRQLLGEKKHEFRKLLKYVMFSIIICAHVSETILCVAFGGTCNFGMCPKLKQKSPASMFGNTPGGGLPPVHTKFWQIKNSDMTTMRPNNAISIQIACRRNKNERICTFHSRGCGARARFHPQ